MASINVSEFNRKSTSDHNSALIRQVFLPAVGESYPLRSGPSAKTVALVRATDVDSDIAGLCHLFDRWKFGHGTGPAMSRSILDHIPVTFTLGDEKETKVAVFVDKIDHEPDRGSYPEFFQDGISHDLGQDTMLISGWYAKIPRRYEQGRNPINRLSLKRCMVFYNPTGHTKGYLAEVLDEQPLPATQVIKDIDALQYLLDAHYKGGYMESVGPTGTRWGRLQGGLGMVGWQWVELSALREVNGAWKFKFPRRDEVMSISLVGTSFSRTSVKRVELKGDAILCSDGTILHTYYFSRAEVIVEGAMRVPDDWHDGYYYNRFYPPKSPLIPAEVMESFNSQMPEYFRNALLLETEAV